MCFGWLHGCLYKTSACVPLRILQRPQAADTYISETLDTIFWNRNSIVSRIQHSHVVGQVFNRYVNQIEDSPVNAEKIRNLSARKHRIESGRKPMVRATFFIDALVLTSEWILVHRSGSDEAADAERFLNFLDEERYLTIAMYLDGADSALAVTRFLDSEQHESAELHLELLTFANICDYLWLQEHCKHHGFTQYALDVMLSKQRVYFIKGVPKSFGGSTSVSRQVINRCIGRMQAWVRLSMGAVQSEFPDFELQACWSVFDCSKKQQRQCHEQDQREFLETCLKRLAKTFTVNEESLVNEYDGHLPIARAILSRKACSCWEAWREAWLSTQAKAATRVRHPGEALGKILMRYGAFKGTTTSGCEQVFSILDRAWAPQRDHMTHEHEAAEITLLADTITPEERKKIIEGARELWKICYGPPRERKEGAVRFDKGVKRKAVSSALCFSHTPKHHVRHMHAWHTQDIGCEMHVDE